MSNVCTFVAISLFPVALPAADGSVGKGKKIKRSGYGQTNRVCQERARRPMCRIRHPGINAPSAFTNPDKEGCGNNKPRGKCLQTPKGVERPSSSHLFRNPLPLSRILRLFLRIPVFPLSPPSPRFHSSSLSSSLAPSLTLCVPSPDPPRKLCAAPAPFPPFNFYHQVHTHFSSRVFPANDCSPLCVPLHCSLAFLRDPGQWHRAISDFFQRVT